MTQNPSPTLALACDLIRRESVTPQDAGCQDLMRARLEILDFRCETLCFGEVTNLWAVHGHGGPLLVFAGHTDVVPTGPLDAWSFPPFEPTIENGVLYGRGAADMKGSLAAMVTAAESFIARHPNHNGRIGFLITSDEEGPAVNGTVKVVEHLQATGEQIDWCVVGEPSSGERLGDIVKNGRRGSLGGKLVIKGIQGHIAYPEKAKNPIHLCLAALQDLVAETWDKGNEFFPATSMQISNINSGTGATNVIPGLLELLFNFRFSSELSAETLKTRTEAILKRHAIDYALEWTHFGDPFLTRPGALVKATKSAIAEVTGVQTQLSTSGGTSDGRFIAPTGAQVIELGPRNATIHQINECVSVAELDRLSEIYSVLMQRLLVESNG